MTINLQTVNFNAKEGLEEYVERKLNKLEQYYDKIIAVQVAMRVENISEKENKFVDIKLEVPGDDIVVKKSGQSFEECIDLSVDTLKKLIIRKKEKITDR
ncbi:ribosome hibernation-promoting factor, HPF/YfiA family [Moheibacter lacus]|uniref:Ribosome-associated translation inhibitor RaiA n=1 Tax=Moheibacter lacus TaxID=2745851 RepID=A0A838ZPN6_9FLAO|nr:ribosome-associated translation inhibitor RaiA [Moheibacter lacus]MBA5629477.1 ribosome-associated translation inhibitor RaiA [Moheibacter lacus]